MSVLLLLANCRCCCSWLAIAAAAAAAALGYIFTGASLGQMSVVLLLAERLCFCFWLAAAAEDENADDDKDDSPVLRVAARGYCNVAPTDEDGDGGELAASFQGVCLHSDDIFVDRAAETGRRINTTTQLFDSSGDLSLTKAATEGDDATTAAATARGGGVRCGGGEMRRFLSTSQMIPKTRLGS